MSTSDRDLHEIVRELKSRGLISGGSSGSSSMLDSDSVLPEEVAGLLRARRESLIRGHRFSEGDLIKWKSGLKNKNSPAYGVPAIVMEVIDHPVIDASADAGSAYFREPLDIVAGVLLQGTLALFHVDSRRFEPFEMDREGRAK